MTSIISWFYPSRKKSSNSHESAHGKRKITSAAQCAKTKNLSSPKKRKKKTLNQLITTLGLIISRGDFTEF